MSPAPLTMAARLRQLLAAPGLIRAVNVYDPMTARIAESLRFQAIALGGFQLGAHLCTTEPMLTLTERGRIGDSNAIFLCRCLAPSLFSLARGTKGCLERLSTQ